MNTAIDSTIEILETERDRINQAIASLKSVDGTFVKTVAAGKRQMSASSHKRMSEAATARWAVRNAAVAKKRVVSAESRKKMQEAAKARWAAVRVEKAQVVAA